MEACGDERVEVGKGPVGRDEHQAAAPLWQTSQGVHSECSYTHRRSWLGNCRGGAQVAGNAVEALAVLRHTHRASAAMMWAPCTVAEKCSPVARVISRGVGMVPLAAITQGMVPVGKARQHHPRIQALEAQATRLGFAHTPHGVARRPCQHAP